MRISTTLSVNQLLNRRCRLSALAVLLWVFFSVFAASIVAMPLLNHPALIVGIVVGAGGLALCVSHMVYYGRVSRSIARFVLCPCCYTDKEVHTMYRRGQRRPSMQNGNVEAVVVGPERSQSVVMADSAQGLQPSRDDGSAQ